MDVANVCEEVEKCNERALEFSLRSESFLRCSNPKKAVKLAKKCVVEILKIAKILQTNKQYFTKEEELCTFKKLSCTFNDLFELISSHKGILT